MKTTKKLAKEIYDEFHGVLRCLNGGTEEENKRSAPRCYDRLCEVAAKAEDAAKNPGKLLLEDDFYLLRIREFKEKAEEFGKRHALTGEKTATITVMKDGRPATHSELCAAAGRPAHTPGPWTFRRGAGGINHFIGQERKTVCMTIAGLEHEESNARLIAAAPDLLAALLGAQKALRKALPYLPADEESVFCGEWLDKVNEVIVKATGA